VRVLACIERDSPWCRLIFTEVAEEVAVGELRAVIRKGT
jgi:hypothetical protein